MNSDTVPRGIGPVSFRGTRNGLKVTGTVLRRLTIGLPMSHLRHSLASSAILHGINIPFKRVVVTVRDSLGKLHGLLLGRPTVCHSLSGY